MRRAWSRWFVRAAGLALVACTDSFVPPPPYQQVPVRLAFAAQPVTTTAGVPFSPSLAVIIEDSAGDTVTTATNVVTLQFDRDPGGGALIGTARVAAIRGVATFANLRIAKAGVAYTLKAAATGLIGVTSDPFTILPGPAARLGFIVQPSNVMGGVVMTPPVQIAAQDSVNNRATGFEGSVTVALAGNQPPGTLSGTTTVNAVGGVATFGDLSVAQTGAAYTLTASAAGLNSVSSTPFAVAQSSASLHITAPTSGTSLDPDGYSACVDPAPDGGGGFTCAAEGSVAVNGSLSVPVDTGAHAVLLRGVAASCSVSGDNPRYVHAAPGAPTEVSFGITCSSLTLHVTTTTTGVSLPGGYYLCIDPGYYGCYAYYSAIGLNSSVTVPVDPGPHTVELDGVPGRCTAPDNPRTAQAGTPTEVPFVITCVAAGTVRLTTVTTGVDLDPDGYLVCIDGASGACTQSASVSANGTNSFGDIVAGAHTFVLSGVAPNCSASGGASRTATVPADGTVDVAFAVSCVPVARIAFSLYGSIAIIREDGSGGHSITPGFAPAWAPNGLRLAYECGQDLCAINADSTGFARLTTDAADNHHPTWSPDGSKIAFAATHASSVPSVFEVDLYAMAANGSGVVRLTQSVGFLGSPAWSPDGTRIAFDCRVEAGNDDLCAVNADGSGFTRLTTDPARDYGAAWKPDGSALAFATTRYGSDEVAILSVPTGNVTRIGLPGFAPAWSSDGSELAVVQVFEDYYGYTYDAILVGHADGSNLRYLTVGDQPAWKPQP